MNIVDSIYQEPEKWRVTEFTFVHEDGAQVWIKNIPILDTNMYPSIHMGIATKFKLWRAMKWWAKNAPVKAFSRGAHEG